MKEAEKGMQHFPAKIHQMHEERNLFQKDMADALSIDSSAYCRIEKGERRAKREQVLTLATYLQADKAELLILWLTDQVSRVLSTDRKIAKRILSLANQSISR